MGAGDSLLISGKIKKQKWDKKWGSTLPLKAHPMVTYFLQQDPASTPVCWGPSVQTHALVGTFHTQTMTSGLTGNVSSEMFPRAPDRAI